MKPGKLLVFLLLASAAMPLASAGSPWFINDIQAQVNFSGEINLVPTVQSETVNWLEGTFYIVPQTSSSQSARIISITPETYSIGVDDFGNSYLKFRWENPTSRKLKYEVVWEVNVSRFKYAITSPGDPNAEPPAGIGYYLQPDNLTQWTGYIKAKAESLINGSSSTLESARRIAKWVSSEISYDKSCWDDSFPAEQVFKDRIGVCDEFTNLFISMCRSVGIPTRYIEGLVFSGEEWNFHAWAEVYLNQTWVPVDPTYDEVGFIDSSHITLASVHGDEDVYNSLNWQANDVTVNFGKEDAKVELQNSLSKPIISMDVTADEAISGSEAMNVTVSLSSLVNSFVVATCSISMPPEMDLLDSKEKSVLIAPHERVGISWKIASPSDLDTKWLHKMPVQILCFPGENFTNLITIDPRSEEGPLYAASITDLTAVNKTTILVGIRNDGTGQLSNVTVNLCLRDGVLTCLNKSSFDIGPGENRDVDFSGLAVGEGDIISARLVSNQFSIVSKEITLSDLEVPEHFQQPSAELPEPAPLSSPENEQMMIIIALMILALILVSVAVAVMGKR